MSIQYTQLTHPTPEIAETIYKWENDPALVHLIRPNDNADALTQKENVTVEFLNQRLEHDLIYLIHVDGQLVGEMSIQIDPPHLCKKEAGTAWIGITIGEESARGKGLGVKSISYLEEQIKVQGLKRIELGVFEFNEAAKKLYTKLGYKEIARIDDFTFWDGKMWQDIRMEKYV